MWTLSGTWSRRPESSHFARRTPHRIFAELAVSPKSNGKLKAIYRSRTFDYLVTSSAAHGDKRWHGIPPLIAPEEGRRLSWAQAGGSSSRSH